MSPLLDVTRRATALAVLAAPLLAGCIASNVVAREDRATAPPRAELALEAGPPERLEGLWESVEIRGEAAAHLARILYLFEARGRYTAAALVLGPEGATFQTLEGTWSVRETRLVLDDAEPVELRHGQGHVLIDAPTGSVLLRSVELE